MCRGACLGLALLFVAGAAQGQQPADCDEAPDAAVEADTCPVPSDEAEPEPTHDARPQIRVLQHPYDLASFYRADGQQPGFYERAAGAYPISSYYRGGVSARGYSRFWTTGYGPRPVGVVPYGPYGRRGAVPYLDYRDRIGENGDLFLMAPILAPIGPLSDVFFSVEIR
jgi:hypothetical protein